MPWIEVNPMDQKVLFIADWLRGSHTMSELCNHYGISRKTGYKWLERYRLSGVDGLNDASRKPHSSPQKLPYAMRQAILTLRRQGDMVMGPKKIQALLKQRYPKDPLPSKTTIYNVLHAEGAISKQRRKQRVSPYPHPFAPVENVNDVWSADFKGQFKMKDGVWCYPLTVMDHKSRYLLCCQGLVGTRFSETQEVFKKLFNDYGLPQRIRTDNGVPFASKAAGGLSPLAAWWITLGILPERIEPGKPQQNGRHERMHRTLKQTATRPPEQNFLLQQKRFDQFIKSYNQDRPHEALQQKTPASCYQPSSRTYTEAETPLKYPGYYEVRSVQGNGVIYLNNHTIYISPVLKGNHVGLKQIDQKAWEVHFGPIRLGYFDEDDAKQKSVSYITLKSVTHVS